MINLHRQNNRAGGGVCIFIHESIDFKERKDLRISKNDSGILSIEITKKTKNIILCSVYTPNATATDHMLTNTFLNQQFKTRIIKTKISYNFPIFLIRDPITSSEKKQTNTPL